MNEPLTDEEYAQLVELGGLNEMEAAKMARQLELAKQLRSSTTPQMRSAGGQIYAPGRAESIVGALGSAMAGYQQTKGMKAQEGIAANNQKQRALLLRGILSRGSGAQMPGMNTGMPMTFPDYPEN